MKFTLLFYTTLNLILAFQIAHAQCILEDIYVRLNSDNYSDRSEAIDDILYCKLEETLGYLEERFPIEDDLNIAEKLLSALDSLHSPEIIYYSNYFISNAENYDYYNSQYFLLSSKLSALNILFKHSQYENNQLLFEFLENHPEEVNAYHLSMLETLILNLPEIEPLAKIKLVEILTQTTSEFNISLIVQILSRNYEHEYESLILNYFLHGDSFLIKYRALQSLFNINYYELKNVLINQLSLETNRSIRIIICDSLLNVWGNPFELKIVIDHMIAESDPIANSMIGFKIRDFIPPRPTVSTAEMIQNLLGYCSSLLKYGWITEEYVNEEISQMIALIEEYYHGQAVPELCSNLETYIAAVEDRFNESLITIEAYKFLFYHGNYIKDNVELEFGDCQ